MRSIAERENRQTFASLTLTGTLGVGGVITGAGYSGGPVSGTTGSFSGAVTGASYAGGPVSGTTATFTGVGQFDTLVLNKATNKGIKVDTATPTYPWQDMLGSINVRATGPQVPTFTTYLSGIFAYAFDRAGMQDAFVEFHIIHDYVPGSDVYVHSHWSTISTATGDVNWLFELAYAKGYNQAAFEGTAGVAGTVTIPVTQAGGTAFWHQIAEVQASSPNGVIASAVNVSITAATPTLTAASALWTAADIGRTIRVSGAGAAGGNLDTTISAFTSTTQVTLAVNATTTVTAQPAYKARVLDSNLLQVDGVILCRVWRDATRAADTLNQNPYLHFCDCHYQTTGIGTKQRNGPTFYT